MQKSSYFHSSHYSLWLKNREARADSLGLNPGIATLGKLLNVPVLLFPDFYKMDVNAYKAAERNK